MTQLLVRTWQRIDKRCGEKKFYNGRPRVIKLSWERFIFFSGWAYHVNESRVAGEPTEWMRGYDHEWQKCERQCEPQFSTNFQNFTIFAKKWKKLKSSLVVRETAIFSLGFFGIFEWNFWVKNEEKNNFFIKK